MANILVLEDFGALRRILTYALNEDGHAVTQGDSGRITHCRSVMANLDVMITDIFMPGSDGIEAILMAKKAKPDLKIIAISAGSTTLETDYLLATLQLGASNVLRKPFEPDKLVSCVRNLLAA